MSVTNLLDSVQGTQSHWEHQMEIHHAALTRNKDLTPEERASHRKSHRYAANVAYQMSKRDGTSDFHLKMEKFCPDLIGDPFSELSDGSDRAQITAG